jgi:molybdopterin converting factor subunit 1
MSSVTVLYFAGVKDLLGCAEEALALPDDVRRLDAFVLHLVAVHPELEERVDSVRFAVNETFANANDPIAPGDVVAVIPPVAGG